MRQALKYVSMALLLTAIFGVECAAKKKPKLPPDPKFMAIQNILVLPLVDSRVGEKASVNKNKLQASAVNALKRKRYPVTAASTSGEMGQAVEEDFQDAKPEWVKKLGPADARWVIVVCLRDVISKMTFGSAGNAEVSGYLFDKESGELVWKGKGVGQAGQGGLLGMTMKGAMKGEALDAALYDLFSSIPTRPKSTKE
ncbi:MAG: hypothetical protein LAO04_18920 [Acidobacteriia bacterium]|nr:hypothetical protein [Terriglobia bacterium]